MRVNLANVILQLKALGVPNIAQFGFVDPPKAEVVNDSVDILQAVNALDEKV